MATPPMQHSAASDETEQLVVPAVGGSAAAAAVETCFAAPEPVSAESAEEDDNHCPNPDQIYSSDADSQHDSEAGSEEVDIEPGRGEDVAAAPPAATRQAESDPQE